MTARVVSAPGRPRLRVRIFWFLHRVLYRISLGRIGLAKPKPGVRFGMMRLHTIGRRSGKSRVAIVGYFEDGPNLVTLAMNGWADADPAWWLNLQTHPHAIVDLVDGTREVTARPALGEERSKLWQRVDEYPGWGADLDALASARSNETAVVVLEPHPTKGTSL